MVADSACEIRASQEAGTDVKVTRDVAKIVDSLRNRSFSQHSAAKPALDVDAISSSHRGDGISRGFAADAAAQQ
eukprot:1147804-Pelagomonas_calceolata.AAC.1